MKKGGFILIAIIIVGISSFADIAVRLSEDPQWTPFVQSWNRKLTDSNKGAETKETDITICSSAANDSL